VNILAEKPMAASSEGLRCMIAATAKAGVLLSTPYVWRYHVVARAMKRYVSNGMLWFDPEPGRPNSVGPGKRALVNMVPVLALRRGEPYLSLGAPGGRKIISAIPQVLSNLADLKLAPQAAIEAPRLHTEGGDLWVDDRVGEKALAALRKMGHPVVKRRETSSTFYFSRPVAIRVTRRGLEAGLDHLRSAAAAGH
jgi:gamma-glutamyltranspeptidase/glutathione hydrolase